jgi:predicted TIM-barrel fold metal-dependent hydrolase
MKLRDRAPKVVTLDEADYWVVDGEMSNSFAGGAQAGVRFEDAAKLRSAARFSEVRDGAYQPHRHVTENRLDGIYGSVLYPTEGLLLFSVRDTVLLHEICRAYNDWIAEFCASDPESLKGIAMIVVDDIDWAQGEIRRVLELGMSGVMIPVAPAPDATYGDTVLDPVWDLLSQSGTPVSLHIATNRAGLAPRGRFQSVSAATLVNCDYWVRTTIADMILSGVMERFATLTVGTVEHELSWIPFFIDRLDYTYTQRAYRDGWHRFRGDMLPSDYFRRNVFASFQEDTKGVADCLALRIDRLMFGSDYPHTESTFPHSSKVFSEQTTGLVPAVCERLAWLNCAEVYNFSKSKLFRTSP